MSAKMDEGQLREHLTKLMADVKLETLPAFIDEALRLGGQGYGEICVALGAIAAAAANAANRSPQGGITGFQAGAVFWEFVGQWGVFDKGPKKIVCFHDALYPQHAYKFAPTLSSETWAWLQGEARRLIAEHPDKSHVHPEVYGHWEAIAAGTLPFGMTIADR